MEIEYLAGMNLLIAAYLVKIAVSPNGVMAKGAGAVVFGFVIINAISLGSGLSA